MVRTLFAAGLIAFAASTASAETTITQTVPFNTIAPFGTYTDGQIVKTGWKDGANPVSFPFNSPDQISNINIAFTSTDAFYQAQVGPNPPPGGNPAGTHPLGGVPEVEVNFLNPARVGIVSLTKSSDNSNLFDLADPQNRFKITRELLTDTANAGANPGNLGVRLGGFVEFFDNGTNAAVSSDGFSFGPSSTFTVTVTGTPTPEPASLTALGATGAALLRRPRR